MLGFQSTCPARGTTYKQTALFLLDADFNPRAPRGARLLLAAHQFGNIQISIHVPREGHDFNRRRRVARVFYFNPRAPRGARPRAPVISLRMLGFQSTCPARGTTRCRVRITSGKNISIHVPREGHDRQLVNVFRNQKQISIHVPREGHDSFVC